MSTYLWAFSGASGLGALLLLRGVWWDRARGRPRCPRCWYLMIGAPSSRCPECGHLARRERDLYRTRRSRPLIALGALLLLVLPAGLAVKAYERIAEALKPRWERISTLQLGRFTVLRELERSGEGTRVRILHDGECKVIVPGWRVDLGGDSRDGTRTIGLGDDLTGDGVPDLIVHDYSGGAHCCLTYYIFELDPHAGPRPLATLNALHGHFAFEDADGDGRVECFGRDWTFAYWETSFAGSPAPEIVLRFRSGRFVLADDLMRTPAPLEAELAAMTDRILHGAENAGQWNAGAVPPDYWACLLDLIYHGHEPLAWDVAERAWPPGTPGRAEFLHDFRAQLSQSPYWPDVRAVSPNR